MKLQIIILKSLPKVSSHLQFFEFSEALKYIVQLVIELIMSKISARILGKEMKEKLSENNEKK